MTSDKPVVLKSFPADHNDALAMLYMQNQDLTGKTPEELANMYSEARARIFSEFSEIAIRKKEQDKKDHPRTSILSNTW